MEALLVMASNGMMQVQDLGRYGAAELGVSQGGAMDLHAFCWANYLLNNPVDAAQLEMTLGPVRFNVLSDCNIAITGADMGVTLDGVPLSLWQTHRLLRGQVLQFGYARQGLRAYLAIEHGFHVIKRLGSASTVSRNRLGGIDGDGGGLKVGDCLSAVAPSLPYYYRAVPTRYVPMYQEHLTVSLMESYQAPCFEREQKQRFYASSYQVTQYSDRMGYRLHGEKITPSTTTLLSQPIACGSVQFPANGEPIILLRDRQTLGGYPILGCITQRDLSLVGQLKPGDMINFRPMSDEQFELEQQKWFTFCQFFNVFRRNNKKQVIG